MDTVDSSSPKILFEDENYLALFKPNGLPTAPEKRNTLSNAPNLVTFAVNLRPQIRTLSETSFHPTEPGLLHRLDNQTSGAVLFAKTEDAFQHARNQWNTEAVIKLYRARVAPFQKPDEPAAAPSLFDFQDQIISFPIGHSNKSTKKMVALLKEADWRKIRGKPQDAVTKILKITRSSSPSSPSVPTGDIRTPPSTFDLEIRIFTGVRHQIRVHLASIGYPIAGDTLYRGHPSTRLWLHAEQISFMGPDGQKVSIHSPAW